MSAVGQVNDFMTDSRWYIDPGDQSTLFESVTNIISSCTGKPWLTAWSAKIAAQYSVDHYDFIGLTIVEAGKPAAVDLIKGAAKRIRELKAAIGTYQHDVVEALIKDTAFPIVPEHLVDAEVDGERIDLDLITEGFLNFVEDHNPVFALAEATVANLTERHAGTLDVVAELPALLVVDAPSGPIRPAGKGGIVLCIDVKTGAVLDVGMGAQLAAYRNSDEVWVDHMGRKAPMPKTDGGAILHLRPEYERGYKLLLVDSGPVEYEWFLQMTRAFHQFKAQGSKLRARALYPPLDDGTQPPPMLEDTALRTRGVLVTAGIIGLTDLARLTHDQLAGIKGIGPKALDDCVALLAEHGLALKDEVA